MSDRNNPGLIIVGGGLAGCEAALQVASRGIRVRLYEMRPGVSTGAHRTANLAELVCSNSLGSNLPDRASGIVKDELRTLNSYLIKCADESAVPAGGALAVDRELFAQKVTSEIEKHPLIEVVRQEMTHIPEQAAIIATGPLTSSKLVQAIQNLTGQKQVYFYDAIAPIITRDSINFDIAYPRSRYGQGNPNNDLDGGDYLNCPMGKDEYYYFVDELINAERIPLREFEQDIVTGVGARSDKFFEGCLPIEIIASRGREALAYGPMRPVGLTDPRTGAHSYAVVQLRQDNLAKTLFNLVGFQTNLKYSEQARVFRLIPGLEKAEFERFGQMHRNTFINAPELLHASLQFKQRDDVFFAGQLTGVEGYVGNIATGLIAGWNAARYLAGEPLVTLPTSTMIGALCHYISHARVDDFQPMKANLGILKELEMEIRGRKRRAAAYAERAKRDLKDFIDNIN